MAIYTILGEQTVLCEKKINDLLTKHQIESFDVVSYDMKEATIQEALFDLQTVAFLSNKKAVIVRNPSFLTGKEGKGDPAHDLNVFINFLEHPVTENILIVYAPYEKLDERKKVVKILKKQSEVFTFETYSEQSLKQWAEKKLKAEGIECHPKAIELLIKLTHAKIDVLYHEIEKIYLYFMNQPSKILSVEVVELLVARQLEDNVFLLTDALVQRKIKEAYLIYEDLMTQNEEPFKLLILIANQFRLMSQVIGLSKQGYREADIAKTLNVHPYRVKLIHGQSHRFEQETIAKYLYQLADIDYKIKSGVLQKELALEMFILNL
ncbi:DNA polymerase III subunit delta [Turicibacter bilis]|uniref:DNA polymerase III subunit delta n=1 Tax=Turicibacter bilis TaxID=2735723 RepID=UPI0006C0E6D5|nr:DNA polymerase III subunit delta [Turicibacter bilis]MBS3203557.1 DNA polymerase III subunit delta [Turicibacter bilis]MDY4814004.1 DNA polymerase III subunit delta [Turicibacter bilis]UUF10550.1 DNA polymerase III subunit delta [Turicibacter bilis]CUP93621.1 DNA polymerase III subunit delta [Turicibacter sanguinis]